MRDMQSIAPQFGHNASDFAKDLEAIRDANV
jgi:hypothetical protein